MPPGPSRRADGFDYVCRGFCHRASIYLRVSSIDDGTDAHNWRSLRCGIYVFGVMSSGVSAVARWISPFLAVAAVAGIGCSVVTVNDGPAPVVRLASDGNPLAGLPFYVNPSSKAQAAADGVDPRSPELDAIANTPTAYWMDNLSTPAVDAKYIAAAQTAGTMPVLALYGIRIATAAASPRAGSGRPIPTKGGSMASHPPSARDRRRSSSNLTRSPWPTACRVTSARNAST